MLGDLRSLSQLPAAHDPGELDDEDLEHLEGTSESRSDETAINLAAQLFLTQLLGVDFNPNNTATQLQEQVSLYDTGLGIQSTQKHHDNQPRPRVAHECSPPESRPRRC